MTLIVLRSTRVLWRMSLNFGLSDVFLVARLWLWVLQKEYHRGEVAKILFFFFECHLDASQSFRHWDISVNKTDKISCPHEAFIVFRRG